jgi:hypothetical protein
MREGMRHLVGQGVSGILVPQLDGETIDLWAALRSAL